MSKFHSTVSRRDFMKGLGLAGAGLGAAAATTPVFHDLDELISAGDVKSDPMANFKRPWWITEREFKNPTTEIDWSILQAWDWNYEPSGTNDWHPRFGTLKPELCPDTALRQRVEEGMAIHAEFAARVTSFNDQQWNAQAPGWALRDKALSTGAGYLSFGRGLAPVPFEGNRVTTPEERGVPKWTGTPEEATNMLRTAAHYYGSAKIGVVEHDADTKKMFYPNGVRFEGIDQAYQDGGVSVIPNKCQWSAYFTSRDSDEGKKRDETSQSGISRYVWGPIIHGRVQSFVKSLGYQMPKAGAMNVPMSVLSGNGELGRSSKTITPEWGAFGGYAPGMVTDLPLAPTKPIDAGIWKFCKACKLCGEICQETTGTSSIPLETEPTWEIDSPCNRVGVKKYHQKWLTCIGFGCGVNYCDKVCPFSTKGKGFASAHELVKATVGTTSIFNGFFTTMGKAFYGAPSQPRDEKDFADFWEHDLNAWPYDTILGAGSGPNGGR